MERYQINGVEVEYDTFDLVNLELFDRESKNMLEKLNQFRETDADLATLRELCEDILDFFDTVVGEGTSEKCFGGKLNAKVLPTALTKFVLDVKKEAESIGDDRKPNTPNRLPAPENREQRRRAERERRRKEAAQVVAARKHAT